MGIIQKQSIKGTIYSYLGVLIGFVTTGLLFPKILLTSEIGLLRILMSISVLFAQFASLGFNSVINRLFPYFRTSDKQHKGFLLMALAITFIGFLLSLLVFEILKPMIIRNNIKESALLVEYVNYIIPLIFFTLFFNLFDTYSKVLFDAVIGTFMKEFIQRLLIVSSLLFYFFGLINIHIFVVLYVISVSLPTIILLVVLITRGEFRLTKPSEKFEKKFVREMFMLSFYGILSGFGTLAIIHIDSILVNKFLGLSELGIYATTFYFGTLVVIPSRPLIKISTTIVAESWKKNDLDNIETVYTKSCLNQAIISLLIFIGLWANIHNIFKILPETYEAGKWVIFFIGLANVFEMSSGINGIVILTSKYFRIHTYMILIFLVLLISLNYLFIPRLGISGAAIATALANLSFNLMRFGFLKWKFNMQPFNYKYIILLVIAAGVYLISKLLPPMENFFIDIVLRSSLMVLLFTALVYLSGISEDVNDLLKRIFSFIRGSK